MRVKLSEQSMSDRPTHRRTAFAPSRDWDLGRQDQRQATRRRLAMQNRRRPNEIEATVPQNKYPPAKPEVLRWLAPQRGLIAIAKSKPKTEKTGHCRLPELSNFGSPPAEPGVYPD